MGALEDDRNKKEEELRHLASTLRGIEDLEKEVEESKKRDEESKKAIEEIDRETEELKKAIKESRKVQEEKNRKMAELEARHAVFELQVRAVHRSCAFCFAHFYITELGSWTELQRCVVSQLKH